MDNAVALVTAYLHINGYFTVAEYPVVEAVSNGGYRTVTDLDILAFRFAGSGRLMRHAGSGWLLAPPHPTLGVGRDQADMVIGEVKEGRAELNQGTTDRDVLRAALTRFGCCPADDVGGEVDALMRHGRATTPVGHCIRLVAFGSMAPDGSHKYEVILLGHIVRFLREYMNEHWEVLHASESKDPALGFLMTVEKALRSSPANMHYEGAHRLEAAIGVDR
jgi:hypothetical protein